MSHRAIVGAVGYRPQFIPDAPTRRFNNLPLLQTRILVTVVNKSKKSFRKALISDLRPRVLVIEFCCKVAVIFLALYALTCVMFCANDCSSAENAVNSLEGVICSDGFRIHNPKVGGSIPPPRYQSNQYLTTASSADLGVTFLNDLPSLTV